MNTLDSRFEITLFLIPFCGLRWIALIASAVGTFDGQAVDCHGCDLGGASSRASCFTEEPTELLKVLKQRKHMQQRDKEKKLWAPVKGAA